MGPGTTRNSAFNKTTSGRQGYNNRNLSSGRFGTECEDLADMGIPGLTTRYTCARNDDIDRNLAKFLNWRLESPDDRDRLHVTFRLLNKLEPGVYQYGTRTVKVRVTYSDYTESKQLQVAEVGNIFVPIQGFITACEKRELDLVERRAMRRGETGKGELALQRDRRDAKVRAHNTGEGGKKSNGQGGTTVECLNYSEELNLIAFGGVQGKIGVLDATTVTFKGLYDAHNPATAGRKGEG